MNDFISNVAEQFNDMDPALISSETEYKMLEDWSSLVALSLIAMVDAEYDIVLAGDDIRNTNTIQELYDLIMSKL